MFTLFLPKKFLMTLCLGILLFLPCFLQAQINFVTQLEGEERFTKPITAAFDEKGRIFIVDKVDINILVWDGRTQTFDSLEGKGIFKKQSDIFVRKNILYAADPTLKSIKMIPLEADKQPRDIGEGILKKPCGLAVDDFGRIYVVDKRLNSLLIFSRDGILRKKISRFEQTELESPEGVIVDRSGRIIVLDSDNKEVYIFNHQWAPARRIDLSELMKEPIDIAVSDKGTLFLLDGARQAITWLDPEDETFSGSFGTRGVGRGRFTKVGAIGYSRGKLLVLDVGRPHMQVFEFTADLDRRALPLAPEPRLLIMDKTLPYSLVALVGETRVSFSRRERLLSFFDTSDSCILSLPTENLGGVTGNEERFFVADRKKSQVRVFDWSGAPLFIIGSKGSDPGDFKGPRGMVLLPEGRLAVCDEGNHRVEIFTDQGIFLQEITSGDLKSPMEISVDEEGNFYVLDRESDAAQVFDQSGTHLRRISPTDAAGEPISMASFALLPGDHMVVLNRLTGQVHILDPTGKVYFEFGGKGIWEPNSRVFTDEEGMVYVSDPERQKTYSFFFLRPPKAPEGMRVVLSEEGVNLVWNAVVEGVHYLILQEKAELYEEITSVDQPLYPLSPASEDRRFEIVAFIPRANIRGHPSTPSVDWVSPALAALGVGNFDLFEEHAQQAAELLPEDERAGFYYRLTKYVYDAGNMTLADLYISKAISLNEREFSYHYLAGQIFKKQGNTKKAHDEFLIALEQDPNLYSAYYEVGNAAMVLGELKQGLDYLDKALLIARGAGAAQELLEEYETTLQRAELEQILINAKETYARANFKKALEGLNRVITSEKASKEQLLTALSFKGAVFIAQGKKALAEEVFGQILSLDPEYQLSELEFSPKIIKAFNKVAPKE